MPHKIQDKVKKLIEDRIVEAVKKQMTQKLILIAKCLGRPIIAQNSYCNHLYDPDLEEEMIYDPTNIRYADDDSTSERGYHFDGLKCGININITTLTYENKVSEIKVTYNGYLVYAEVEGELKAYAPFPAWEDAVNMFHEGAVQIDKKRTLVEKETREMEGKTRAKSFWNKFKKLWGY